MVLGFISMSSGEQADVIEAYLRKDANLAIRFNQAVNRFVFLHLPPIAGKTSRQWTVWLERNGPILQTYIEKLLTKFFGSMRGQISFSVPGMELNFNQ